MSKILMSLLLSIARSFGYFLIAPLKMAGRAVLSIVQAACYAFMVYWLVAITGMMENAGDSLHTRVRGAYQVREYRALAVWGSLTALFWGFGLGAMWAAAKTWRAGASALDVQAPQDICHY